MNEIPKISITQDFVTDDHEDEADEDECPGDIHEAHTDMEDLDSEDGKGGFPTIQLLKTRKKVKSKKIEHSGTDIEDCQDSGSDDAYERPIEDSKLSLNEFLDQGYVEETSSFGGDVKIKQSQRGKRASLLIPRDDDGAITDLEDLNTSDNDETPISPKDNRDQQQFNSFLVENDDYSSGNIKNSSSVKNNSIRRMRTAKRIDQSDSEDDLSPNHACEVENFALSDPDEDEEYCGRVRNSASAFDFEELIMAVSDIEDSYPSQMQPEFQPIEVSFVNNRPKKLRCSTRTRKAASSTLAVIQSPDEAVTDVENLDSSDDEGPNVRKKLVIPIAYVNSNKSLTDVEDFDIDDMDVPSTSRDIKLPSPVREIVVMKEDKHGDPVAKVMPLVTDSSTFLGIVDPYVDKGLTDTEDMSGNEDDYGHGNKYDLVEMPDIDSGIVTSSEGLTTLMREKRGDHEQLTDVEDLRMVGGSKQSRKKRTKPKSSKTKGGLLAVGNDGDDQAALTENEDVYMDEDQAARYVTRKNVNTLSSGLDRHEDGGGVTDTEDFSGDEDLYRNVAREIDPNVFRQETFFSTITLSDSSPCNRSQNQGYSKISTILKTREAHDSSADLSVTDVEELAQSDVDDLLVVDIDRDNSVTPNELRTAFNESVSSHIHDQSRSEFDKTNDDASQLKDYGNIQDSHTDVECLDDDKSKMEFIFVLIIVLFVCCCSFSN